MLIELNDLNNASKQCQEICRELLSLNEPLFGCEMGIAWGGGVEKRGELWRGRGVVWGFDTFTGHPKDVEQHCPDTQSDPRQHATICMDPYYDEFGTESLSYAHIRAALDKQNLYNVVLVKGLVNENTDISFIPKLHYALLDMDFPISTRHGYALIKDKLVSGGYLCLHDVVPEGHIKGMFEIYQEIVASNEYEICAENWQSSLLAVLRKK